MTMQEVITLLKRCRRSASDNPKEARIELLSQLANDATFSGCVPSFEADDRSNVGSLSGILQFAEPLLKLGHRLPVCAFRKTFLEIDGFQQFLKTFDQEWASVLAPSGTAQIPGAHAKTGTFCVLYGADTLRICIALPRMHDLPNVLQFRSMAVFGLIFVSLVFLKRCGLVASICGDPKRACSLPPGQFNTSTCQSPSLQS